MDDDQLEKQKQSLTPDRGFNLVGIDYFEDTNGQLFLVEHFEMYQDALKAKKDRKNPKDYFILYKGTNGEFLSH